MEDLKKENSVSKEPSPLLLDREEVKEHFKKVEDWELSPDGKKISRNFSFKTFSEIIDFINGVAVFAKKIKYYPDVITIFRFKKARVELTNRKIGGLSENDFILAEEIDAIAGWKIRFERWLASPRVLIVLLIIFILVLLWERFR